MRHEHTDYCGETGMHKKKRVALYTVHCKECAYDHFTTQNRFEAIKYIEKRKKQKLKIYKHFVNIEKSKDVRGGE